RFRRDASDSATPGAEQISWKPAVLASEDRGLVMPRSHRDTEPVILDPVALLGYVGQRRAGAIGRLTAP
ncbi:MAG: hypothetical protein CSB46_00220, partial [Micrococcales bacterium]